MSNSAAKMSGASKKVFRAQPGNVLSASKKCLAQPRSRWRIQESCSSATKKCLAHPRIQEMFERNQEVFDATKKWLAHPRSFSGASKSFIVACLVHSTRQSQAA